MLRRTSSSDSPTLISGPWNDEDGHWLELPYGGKVPFDDVHTLEAGGNAANASVGLSRLGVSTGLASHVGNDVVGHAMQAALHREGVDTHLVRFDAAPAEQPELRALVPPGPDDPRAPRVLRLSLAPSEPP